MSIDVGNPLYKKLQSLGQKLRAAGKSEAEIRANVDAYEARLESEEAERHEQAPEGLTASQRAGLEIERASTGRSSFASDDNDRSSAGPSLTQQRFAAIELERAVFGQAKISSDEIASQSIKSATRVNLEVEMAPKGMHPTVLARENLARACRGQPELVPYRDEDED